MAVCPDFRQTSKAFLELFNVYYNSLILLKDNNLHSISFPLISSGVFTGDLPNPTGESAKQCGRAYKKFVQDYPDYEVDVMLCTFYQKEFQDKESFEKRITDASDCYEFEEIDEDVESL